MSFKLSSALRVIDTITDVIPPSLKHLDLTGRVQRNNIKGNGGYGDVYDGYLQQHGEAEKKLRVAIKRLRVYIQGNRDFNKVCMCFPKSESLCYNLLYITVVCQRVGDVVTVRPCQRSSAPWLLLRGRILSIIGFRVDEEWDCERFHQVTSLM